MITRLFLFSAACLLLGQTAPALPATTENPASTSKSAATADLPFPGGMECVARPVYRHRADGKPGREIVLNFKSGKLHGPAQVTDSVGMDGRKSPGCPRWRVGLRVCRVLLPDEVATRQESQVALTLRQGAGELKGADSSATPSVAAGCFSTGLGRDQIRQEVEDLVLLEDVHNSGGHVRKG